MTRITDCKFSGGLYSLAGLRIIVSWALLIWMSPAYGKSRNEKRSQNGHPVNEWLESDVALHKRQAWHRYRRPGLDPACGYSAYSGARFSSNDTQTHAFVHEWMLLNSTQCLRGEACRIRLPTNVKQMFHHRDSFSTIMLVSSIIRPLPIAQMFINIPPKHEDCTQYWYSQPRSIWQQAGRAGLDDLI